MSTAVSVERTNVFRTYLLSALAAIVPLAIAFIGALTTGTGTTVVVDSVLGISGRSNQALGDFSTLLPLGFAFGAGFVASVNPCGFAMLPAYLAMYMGSNIETEPSSGTTDGLEEATVVSNVSTSENRSGTTILRPIARRNLLLMYWIGNAVLVLGTVILLGNTLVLIGNLVLFIADIVIGFVGLLIGLVAIFVGALLRQLAEEATVDRDVLVSDHGGMNRLDSIFLRPIARCSLLLMYWIGNVVLVLGSVTLVGSALVLIGNLVLFVAEATIGLTARLDVHINPLGGVLIGIVIIFVGAGLRQVATASLTLFGRLGKALLVGGVVTSGFVVLFGIAGLIIGGGARQAVDIIPWVGLIIGISLSFVGAWLIGGGKIYTALAQRASAKMGDPTKVSVKGYFLFGLSYGAASLSCTLPIFLTVLGVGIVTNRVIDAVVSFVLFGLGMGTVIVALTIAMAVYKGEIASALRKILPYTQPISATFMILAGAYIVFYWLTEGELLDKIV